MTLRHVIKYKPQNTRMVESSQYTRTSLMLPQHYYFAGVGFNASTIAVGPSGVGGGDCPPRLLPVVITVGTAEERTPLAFTAAGAGGEGRVVDHVSSNVLYALFSRTAGRDALISSNALL